MTALRPGIRITYSISKFEVNFLDLVIYKDLDCMDDLVPLAVRTYEKPLNKYLYIPYTSAHRHHVFKGFIKGRLISFAISNTFENNFMCMRDKFYKRLLDRGYPSIFLDKIFPSVSFNIRTKYLTHGDLVKKVGEAPPALFVPSDYTTNNLVNLSNIVANVFNKHKHKDNTVSHIFGESGPRVVYLKGNNLRDILVNSKH